jgi:hypothetical protein
MKLLYAATVLLAALLSGNQALTRREDTFLLSSAISLEQLALALQDMLNGAIFF